MFKSILLHFMLPNGLVEKIVLGQAKHWLLAVAGTYITAHGMMGGVEWQQDVGAIMVLLGSGWNVGIALATDKAQKAVPVVQSAPVPDPAPVVQPAPVPDPEAIAHPTETH